MIVLLRATDSKKLAKSRGGKQRFWAGQVKSVGNKAFDEQWNCYRRKIRIQWYDASTEFGPYTLSVYHDEVYVDSAFFWFDKLTLVNIFIIQFINDLFYKFNMNFKLETIL